MIYCGFVDGCGAIALHYFQIRYPNDKNLAILTLWQLS